MDYVVPLCLLVISFALFVPKKEKRPELTLIHGGKDDKT